MSALSCLLLLCVGTVSVAGLSLLPFPNPRCLIPLCAYPGPTGELPAELQPRRPACVDQCRTDSDCRGGVCCPGCGCNICQPGIFPYPIPIDSCKTRTCPKGQVCVEDRIICTKAPCPTRSRCVTIDTKPGTCPLSRCPADPTCTEECKTDSDCQGTDKCCPYCTGCRRCLSTGLSNACDGVQCPGGETCVADPTPRCVCKKGQANCFVQPCRFSSCDNHPGAVCSDNYCGGCHAVWRENGRILTDCP